MATRVALYSLTTGDVVNVVVAGADKTWTPPEGFGTEEVGPEVGIGWRRIEAGRFEPIPMTLSERRGRALAAVAEDFTARLASGFNYQGVNYQIDPQSQGNITTYGTRASAVLAGVSGATWPAQFSWIRTDNQRQPFTAAEFYAFSQAAQDYVTALYLVRRAAKDAVAASDNPEAVVSATPWPAN